MLESTHTFRKTNKKKTASERIADILNPAPQSSFDPESYDFGDTVARVIDVDTGIYEDHEPACSIEDRARNLRHAQSLEDMGIAYTGKKISRQELYAEDDYNNDDNDDSND